MSEPIVRIWPTGRADAAGTGASAATDDDIVSWYAPPTTLPNWTRVNFVSSLDGSATHDGLSGGLSDDADKRVFGLLRRLCDVVVVGAGTVRAEGYGGMRVDERSSSWRSAHGYAPQPVFAVVSARLDLDAESAVFTDAPVRPLLVTVASAPVEARRALAAVADIVVCGETHVNTREMVVALAERGLTRIHCEGGPHLFGDLVAERGFDELCLTLSPLLEGGSGRRITDGAPAVPLGMRLAHVLASGDALLLRYLAG